jgi:hypothetical protein
MILMSRAADPLNGKTMNIKTIQTRKLNLDEAIPDFVSALLKMNGSDRH